MDIATLGGIGMCIGLVMFGIIQSGGGPAAIASFIDIPSAIITIGGTIGCIITMNTIPDVIKYIKAVGVVMKSPTINEPETIKKVIELSNVARKEGLLALEEAAQSLDEEFMKKGVLLIVDGTDPELVRGILETDLVCVEARHAKVIGFWEQMAAMGPAWGMIGTLIGLINMLGNLSDVSTVGPNMAVALITTLYGSLIANWLATPIANKMRNNNALESTLKEVMIEGLLSIQAGENPRVIEEKLKSFLSPEQRAAMGSGSEEGGEA